MKHYTDPEWVDDMVELGNKSAQQPHGIKQGQTYKGIYTMRRCVIAYVANWTVGFRYNENDDIITQPIATFIDNYKAV
jgi:hypothetical protein